MGVSRSCELIVHTNIHKATEEIKSIIKRAEMQNREQEENRERKQLDPRAVGVGGQQVAPLDRTRECWVSGSQLGTGREQQVLTGN